MAQVLETNMTDGVDLIHNWKTVKQALKSGRFDYHEDIDDLYNCKSIEELIETISYPFSLIESK